LPADTGSCTASSLFYTESEVNIWNSLPAVFTSFPGFV